MDTVSKQKRSEVMSKVRAKNTKPELKVRKALYQMGYRFRLHRKDLPGKPDICLPKHKTVILVHGCFWHGHNNCKNARVPKSNMPYWTAKLNSNIARDKTHKHNLMKLGWRVIVLWECELKDVQKLERKIKRLLTR